MDNQVKFASFNARGLSDGKKRRKVFLSMKSKKSDVTFLQEMHCTKESNSLWMSQWGNKVLFSNGNSNAKGVGIMFSRKVANKVQDIARDVYGRYIMCKLVVNGYSYCCANIYAPNSDDPTFFDEVFQKIREMDTVFVVLAGDFNTVLDVKNDRNSSQINGEATKMIRSHMEDLQLCDIWRDRNPEEKKFTWCKYNSKKKTFMWSRIDYYLISSSLSNQICECDIQPGISSDHSMISIVLSTTDFPRGKGYWKCNNSLLQNEEFCELMTSELKKIQETYKHLDDKRFWELYKFEIGNICKEFSLRCANKDKNRIYYLYKLLCEMDEELIKTEGGLQDSLAQNRKKVQDEIEAFEDVKTERVMFRCKSNWHEKGLRNSKFFFNLEKRNYTQKTMYIARRQDGTLTKDY